MDNTATIKLLSCKENGPQPFTIELVTCQQEGSSTGSYEDHSPGAFLSRWISQVVGKIYQGPSPHPLWAPSMGLKRSLSRYKGNLGVSLRNMLEWSTSTETVDKSLRSFNICLSSGTVNSPHCKCSVVVQCCQLLRAPFWPRARSADGARPPTNQWVGGCPVNSSALLSARHLNGEQADDSRVSRKLGDGVGTACWPMVMHEQGAEL